jgi:hypothetical protein
MSIRHEAKALIDSFEKACRRPLYVEITLCEQLRRDSAWKNGRRETTADSSVIDFKRSRQNRSNEETTWTEVRLLHFDMMIIKVYFI